MSNIIQFPIDYRDTLTPLGSYNNGASILEDKDGNIGTYLQLLGRI